MKITDLIIDTKSLGSKLWLVEVSPAYEYQNNRRTDTVLGYRYTVACRKRAWKKSMYALTVKSVWIPRMAMWKYALTAWRYSSIGARASPRWGPGPRISIW